MEKNVVFYWCGNEMKKNGEYLQKGKGRERFSFTSVLQCSMNVPSSEDSRFQRGISEESPFIRLKVSLLLVELPISMLYISIIALMDVWIEGGNYIMWMWITRGGGVFWPDLPNISHDHIINQSIIISLLCLNS